MGDLENRVVIITGGARGIGYGIGEAVADQGACVVLADILDEVEESAKKLGKNHVGIKHDVRKAESAKNLVAKTLEKFGHIDVLVNNAGVGPNPAPIQDLTEEEFDRVLDINLRGCSSRRAPWFRISSPRSLAALSTSLRSSARPASR